MIDNIKPLGDLSPEQFLKEYWQKKTLVIRNAFPDFESPITPEELAGLSCEEEVNSRIVIEKDGNHPWQPIYGPMDDDVFSKLPETHWTLLVNDVEKHIPELAWIVDQFRFIPEWRMDDLMISYAPEGGSVGPHMDLYDVFILQAQGHRRWQINPQPVVEDNQVKGTPLRIQKDFVAEEEWLLAPGDLIYIPPGVSHYGVATDDCMSFSIGFRATSHAELVNDFIGYITQDLDTSLTYRDPDLKAQNNPNEITTDAIDRVRNIFKDYLDPDNPKLAEWFGRFVSDTKTDMATQVAEEILNISEIKDKTLIRSPASRFAFIKDGDNTQLFIDGSHYRVSESFAESLCINRTIESNSLSALATDTEKPLLIDLINNGQLMIEDN
ncbi:MAG: cupin domain-containing protein [Gammaproteobacteria bacterium]|nr:cupin domain-containing protein [Gammaproteobacteria bacterium]